MEYSFSTHDPVIVLLLCLPLMVGGVLHMAAVKGDILSYFKKPIHHRWFGLNKTWRGFIIMPLATWPGVLLTQFLEGLFDLNTPLLTPYPSGGLALLLGWGYCLAELPNSFIKRRLGIKEGQTADKKKWLFILIDQADSALGCMLAYLMILPLSQQIFWLAVATGALIHFLFNAILYQVGLRKHPY